MNQKLPTPDTPSVRQLFRYLVRSDDQYLDLKPGESAIIKANWALLHEYCKDYEFTLNEAGTKIRKDKREPFKPKQNDKVRKNHN